jgi:hypothetical protein
MQRAVRPDERAVEVGGDDADVAGEVLGKAQVVDQPFGFPPVALTT